jgi:hypothetical protein
MKFMRKTSQKENHTITVEESEHKTRPIMTNPDVQAGWITALDALFNWLAFLPDAPEEPVR